MHVPSSTTDSASATRQSGSYKDRVLRQRSTRDVSLPFLPDCYRFVWWLSLVCVLAGWMLTPINSSTRHEYVYWWERRTKMIDDMGSEYRISRSGPGPVRTS